MSNIKTTKAWCVLTKKKDGYEIDPVQIRRTANAAKYQAEVSGGKYIRVRITPDVTCAWTKDQDLFYVTECGNILGRVSPSDYDYNFCPFCGMRIL